MMNIANSPDLRKALAWMQAVITDPAGIAAGVASDEARQLIDVRFEELERIVAPSRALTAAQRLAIYSHAYRIRLVEAFRTEFPCVLHALGRELFSDFVSEYLRQYPPSSYTLRDLGKDFAVFLEQTRPDAGAPAGERETWPDFIIDLARFERAFIETYDGLGTEGRRLADHRLVDAIGFDQVAGLRLEPVPCLRLLSFRYPVADYFRASRAQESPQWPAPQPSFVAMSRSDYVVGFVELSPVQYFTLSGLRAGLPAAEGASQAAGRIGHAGEVSIIELRAWVRDWLDLGFFFGPSNHEKV